MKISNYFSPISLSLLILMGLASCSSKSEKEIKVISQLEQKLYNDTVPLKDTALSAKVRNLYIQFADENLNDTLSGTYLFKAADLSVGLNEPNVAVQLLERIIVKFPNHPKVAQALFYQAFIYDTQLHLVESAKEKYRTFAQKFPNDPMAPSANATLMQLEAGLSDEDLVRMFEHKSDSLAALNQK